MSNLTWEKIDAIRQEIERAAPRGLYTPFQNMLAGMRVIEAPPPPPKIQVRELTFDDGTPLLTPAFRASMNAWLAGRFGYQDDPFKDKFFIFGRDFLIGNKKNIAMVRGLT